MSNNTYTTMNNTLPEQLRLAAEIIENKLPFVANHPAIDKFEETNNRNPVWWISKGYEIRLAQPPAPEVAQDPYAELKAAHAAGKRIQYRSNTSPSWEIVKTPLWWQSLPNHQTEYRIHPDDAGKPAFNLAAHVISNGFRALADGEQFHREDWTAEMLPVGTRPLLLGETAEIGDERMNECIWQKRDTENQWCLVKAGPYHLFGRTRRPLPDLPAPDNVKSLGQIVYLADGGFHWHNMDEKARGRWERMAQAIRAAVEAEYRAEVERLKVQSDDWQAEAWKVRKLLDAEIEKSESAEARAKELEARNNRQAEYIERLNAPLGLASDNTSFTLIEETLTAKCVRISELERELAKTRTNYDKYIAKLKEKNDNQRTRINYLEGATHHAGGTPLSRALALISELERELTDIKSEMEVCEKCKAPTPMELVHAGTCYKCIAEQAIDQNTLRPISEAGPVPDGCVRVTGYEMSKGQWNVAIHKCDADTHYADIRLPDHIVGVNRWKPGYTATTITGPDGKVYTPHKPGDAMPCTPISKVHFLYNDNTTSGSYTASDLPWDFGYITGWRYTDTNPKAETVPLEKPEPFNESKWIWMMEWCRANGRNEKSPTDWKEAEYTYNNRKQD